MGDAAPAMRMLLGVMTSPHNVRLRSQWREWQSRFQQSERGVSVRFTLGSSFYVRGQERSDTAAHQTPSQMLAAESASHKDLLFLDGRERLPHVGKVTEKSAAWWLSAASEHPDYAFYCKCDDDTLVHIDRLHAVLSEVQHSQGPEAAVYLGHIKWRGWDVGHRFQACGGGWGPAGKTGDDIAYGGPLPSGGRYPPCPHAAGPYPYMSGGMVCMSKRMASILAADAAFNDFFAAARRRNTLGEPCNNPMECATQPVRTHMWHHEDAGIGFNVFRAVAAANATVSIVPVPGHYNDAGIIERTTSAQDMYWSSRAVFVHGIKGPAQFSKAAARWNVSRANAYLALRCAPCSSPGTNSHSGNWRWARIPCPASISGDDCATNGSACPVQERMCPVEVKAHYKCCGWPWVVPQLRDLVVTVLRSAPTRRLPLSRLLGGMRRELRRRGKVKEPKGCVRDCLNLQLPGVKGLGGVLRELELRGDLQLESDSNDPESVAVLSGT